MAPARSIPSKSCRRNIASPSQRAPTKGRTTASVAEDGVGSATSLQARVLALTTMSWRMPSVVASWS